MVVKVGKAIADKRQCDACQVSSGEEVRECTLPADKYGNHPQYFDLCAQCIVMLGRHKDPYVTVEKPIREIVAPCTAQRRREAA